MADFRDEVLAYQAVRMTVPEAPVAAPGGTEAWQARGAYLQIHFAGAGVRGGARAGGGRLGAPPVL